MYNLHWSTETMICAEGDPGWQLAIGRLQKGHRKYAPNSLLMIRYTLNPIRGTNPDSPEASICNICAFHEIHGAVPTTNGAILLPCAVSKFLTPWARKSALTFHWTKSRCEHHNGQTTGDLSIKSLPAYRNCICWLKADTRRGHGRRWLRVAGIDVRSGPAAR